MAEIVVKDYLGHTCRTTEALAYFEEAVAAARIAANKEPRCIARNIGIELMEISEGVTRVRDGLEAALQLLPNDSDADLSKAVLEVLVPAVVALSNKIWHHSGTALVALERGGLHPAVEDRASAPAGNGS